MPGKLNRGLSWTPDEDAHTCMPAPRPTEGPEASTLRPPGPTSWGAHSRVETSLDYWRRKCSHRPRWGGEGFPWTQAPQPPSQPQPEHPSQPRPQPALHASSLSLCPVDPMLLPGPCPSHSGFPTSLEPQDSGPHLILLRCPRDAEVAAEQDWGIVP